jgi:hypothetical protein
MLAAENLQLVAEHQDLDLLGPSAAEPEQHQGEHSARARYTNHDQDNTPASSRASKRAGYRVE